MNLHRLAQYGRLSLQGRRDSVAREKYPSLFRNSYAAAAQLLSEAIRLRWTGDELFAIAHERWLEHRLETLFAVRQRDLALEAVSRFGAYLAPLNRTLKRLGIEVGVERKLWEPLEIEGVKVVDTPALVLRRERMGVTETGLLSFHISKWSPHSTKDAQSAAILLYEFAGANQELLGEIIEPGLCVAVDVFSGEMADADRGRKRAMSRMHLACDEIAVKWRSL